MSVEANSPSVQKKSGKKGVVGERTGDLPDQVIGDVCAFGGHGDGYTGIGGIEKEIEL